MDLIKIDVQSILLRSTHYGLSIAQLSAKKTTTKQKKRQEKITEKKSELLFFENCNQKCQEGVSSKNHY